MKLRRRHHPERTGQKSAPSATAGKRIAPKIMTSKTTQFYNHAGELIDTEKLQAAVVRNTKLHEEMCKLSGVPSWKLLKQQIRLYRETEHLLDQTDIGAFNDMMKAQGKKVRVGQLEKR
mgnify:CR=1 FL=1